MAPPNLEKPTDEKAKIELVEELNNDRKAEGDHFLVDNFGSVRKLPVPSADPNDPLNYSWAEKFGVVLSCCWFCRFML